MQRRKLIIVHGNFSSSLHFVRLIKTYHLYHILAPDMRGFGDQLTTIVLKH